MTFLIFLLAFYLNNLTAASEEEIFVGPEEALPVFALNHEVLVKPEETACMQWLELLEVERNKADYLGNFQAFKAFTKEISATIGGKYGFSIPSTPEETIALSYSIIRTRHKFCGKRNMLGDFYGVRVVTDDPEVQHYLSLVMAIDTMAAKAINDEDDTFFDQWTAVSQTGTTHDFIEAVRNYELKEKTSLFAALDKPLTAVLTDGATMVTIKEVFDIFAPKITLKKIYSEMMVGGEYRGWTLHGADAFAYPISLRNEGATSLLNNIVNQELATDGSVEVLCYSAVANFPSLEIKNRLFLGPEKMILKYAYDQCLNELGGLVEKVEPKYLYLTKTSKPKLSRVFSLPCSQVPEAKVLNIYKHQARFAHKLLIGGDFSEDISFLITHGDTMAMCLYTNLLSEGGNGIARDMPKAIELAREAADLGDKAEGKNLPIYLIDYSVELFDGANGTEKDIPRAMELCREAVMLDDEQAKRNLLSFLSKYAVWLLNGSNEVKRDVIEAIKLCREAVFLGSRDAKRNLPLFLSEYGKWLFKGENGFERDMGQAIKLFKESTTLGNTGAKGTLSFCLESYIDDLFYGNNGIEKNAAMAIKFCKKMAGCWERKNAETLLPIYLFNYGVYLYNGEEGVVKDIPNSIKYLRESSDLRFERAKELLPNIIHNYTIWLFNGENGVTQDMQKAIEFCKESTELGCEKAKEILPLLTFNYGLCLFEGANGISQNLQKATAMFMESAKLGYVEAEAMLGKLRNFVEQDNADWKQKFSIRQALSGFGRLSLSRRANCKFYVSFAKLDDLVDEVLSYEGIELATEKFNEEQLWDSREDDDYEGDNVEQQEEDLAQTRARAWFNSKARLSTDLSWAK